MPGTSNRGFASMDAQKQREIASKGGKAAHQKGTAHQFTSEEARRAGSKGGRAARQKRTAAQQAAQMNEEKDASKKEPSVPFMRRTGNLEMVDPRYTGPESGRDIKGNNQNPVPDSFESEPIHRAS